MEKEVTLTIGQLKAIFIAGSELERQHIDFEFGDIDKIDAPDFGEFIEQEFKIKI
jgi:hypothetical protein